MKRQILLSIAIVATALSFAQSSKQVRWNYTVKKIADKLYEVHLSATINDGYHLYAQSTGIENIEATVFTFAPNPLIALNGKVKESGKLISKYEPAVKHDVKYYEKEVDFVQVIKLKANVKTDLSGKVEFTVCNNDHCLPTSDVAIKVNVGG